MTNQSPRWRVGKAPTIYDVARECGVAPSTVSRTFSRPGRVNAETAERIRAVAGRLGYRTSPPARALSTGRSSMVALVIPDVTNPVYFDLTRGAEDAAAEAGYTLLLADFRETSRLERKAIDRAVPAVAGLVLGGPRISDSAIRMAAKQRPTVVLNRAVTGLPSVVIDNPRGMRRAAEHLGALGHTAITYLAGPTGRAGARCGRPAWSWTCRRAVSGRTRRPWPAGWPPSTTCCGSRRRPWSPTTT